MGLTEGDASRRSVLKGSALGAGALIGAAGLAGRQRAAAATTTSTPNTIPIDGETIFLKLDGITGESQAAGFAGYIELISFSFGATNSAATTSRSTGAGSGRAKPLEISVTKYIDKSSPILMLRTAQGKLISTGQVQVAAQGDRLVYLKVELTDVLVSSYRIDTDTGSGGGLPTESFALSFDKIQYSYYPQAPAGGLDRPVTMAWNIKTAKLV
jgi:type VI secretion system secreted protein Hcp